jgi:hypothetical protein
MIKRDGSQKRETITFPVLRRPQELTVYVHLHGDRFQLRQVIQIVTCHGFNERAEVHLSTLGMVNGL